MTTLSPTAALSALATHFLSLGTHIAIGTSVNTPILGNGTTTGIALGAEVDRNAVTVSTASGSTCSFEAFFSTSEPSTSSSTTVAEVGLFNSSSAGTLQIWGQPIIPVVKTTSQTLLVTMTVTFSNA